MKKIIVGIIIGIVLTTSINIVGASIESNGIMYKSKTLNTVLDDLYSKINEINSTGDASASDILSGKTALVKGEKVTGSIINLSSSATITHSSVNDTPIILGDDMFLSTNSDGIDRLQIRYAGGGGIITNNTLLAIPYDVVRNKLEISSDKIASGQTILGITGTSDDDYKLNLARSENNGTTTTITIEKDSKLFLFTDAKGTSGNVPLLEIYCKVNGIKIIDYQGGVFLTGTTFTKLDVKKGDTVELYANAGDSSQIAEILAIYK